jgi:hypothetical protein
VKAAVPKTSWEIKHTGAKRVGVDTQRASPKAESGKPSSYNVNCDVSCDVRRGRTY